MSTLHKRIFVAVSATEAWDAIRDIGQLHTRLVPGFVRNTELEGQVRIVTFGNGMVVREPIISLDDERQRLAWTAQGGRLTHYNAVMEVEPAQGGCWVRWTIDILPDERTGDIEAMQDQGLATLREILERGAPARQP